MAISFISKILKRPSLLTQQDLEEYNKGLEKLKEIEGNFNNGLINKAYNSIESYHKDLTSAEKPIPLLLFDSLLIYFKVLIYKTRFDVIEELLTENIDLINLVKSSKEKNIVSKYLLFNLILSSYHIRKGEYKEAEEILNNAKTVSNNITNSKEKLQLKNHQAILKIINNDFQGSLDLLSETLDSIEGDSFNKYKARINNNIGLAYLYLGDLTNSNKHFNIALELAQKSQNKVIEFMINNNIGLYNYFNGNIVQASNLLEQNLDFYQQLDLNFELANTYINLSSFSETKGEIVQSQTDLTSAIDIINKINNNHFKFICNNNFANLAFVTGEFDSAQSAYTESLEYFKTNDLYFDSIISLFNLLSLAVLDNNITEKEKYLEEIKQIINKCDTELFTLIYSISRGLDLKQNDRMVKKAEAQQIFTNIANSSKPIYNEFKVIALKNLCELLIEELSSSGDQEVIDELKAILARILSIAEEENSDLLRVESFLIQSKLDLLDYKLNESRSILSQAQTIAEEKGLTALAIFGSREYDNLLNQIAKYQDQGDLNLSNLSRNERLELAELENMVNKIIRKRAEIPDITEESPYMFLIIAMSGMSIFSKLFVEENLMDEQLIGGFITAINIVTQQAFSDQDAIEGIRHQDFTLLLKYLGETRILCVYVFKGQTYFAMQKLKTFIETVQYSEAMPLIDEANDIGNLISDEPVLLDLVTEIFQKSDGDSFELAKRNFFSQKISATINHGLMIDDVSLFD